MIKNKKIFKKKNKPKFRYIILIFFLILIIYYLWSLFTKDNFFIVSKFLGNYYIIPEDRGGIEIPNQNKKSLHYTVFDICN